MTQTILRVFDDRDDALHAAEELERIGIPRDDISFLAANKGDWYKPGYQPMGRNTDNRHTASEAADGAKQGALTGGVIGGGAGLLAGLGMLAIPALGPVVAAGWLAATATGAVAGAAAGGAAGGLIGALTSAGVSEEDAHVASEAVKRGSALLSVRVPDDRVAEVRSILDRTQARDLSTVGQGYRDTGWSRFDATT